MAVSRTLWDFHILYKAPIVGSRNWKIAMSSLGYPDGHMPLRMEAGQISKEEGNNQTVVSEVEKGKKLRKAGLAEGH